MGSKDKKIKTSKTPPHVQWAKRDLSDSISQYSLEEKLKQQIIAMYWENTLHFFKLLSLDSCMSVDTPELEDFLHSSLDEIMDNSYTVYAAAKDKFLYVSTLFDFSPDKGPVFRIFRIYRDEICMLCQINGNTDSDDDSDISSDYEVVRSEDGKEAYIWYQLSEDEKAGDLFDILGIRDATEDEFANLVCLESESLKEGDEEGASKYIEACVSFYDELIALKSQCYPNVMFEFLHLKDDFGLFQPCLVPASTNLYGVCIIEDRDKSFSVCQCYDLYMRNQLSGFDSPDDDGHPDNIRVVKAGMSFDETVEFINDTFNSSTDEPYLMFPSLHGDHISVISSDLGNNNTIKMNLAILMKFINEHKDYYTDAQHKENDLDSVRYMISNIKDGTLPSIVDVQHKTNRKKSSDKQ